MTDHFETAFAIYSHAFMLTAIVATAATLKERREFSIVGKVAMHVSLFGVIYFWAGFFG